MNLPEEFKGLTNKEVEESRQKNGHNDLEVEGHSKWHVLAHVFMEPMLILLIVITTIYFILGEWQEAFFMMLAMIVVIALELYQYTISDKALDELKKLSEPISKVIRNGEVIAIPTSEIVIGDLCLLVEGNSVNADAAILYSNDFSVNESSLTGESISVFKSTQTEDKFVYAGTAVVAGLAIVEVTAIGVATKVGQIGKSLAAVKQEKSPLQIQINRFVKSMAIIGIVIFCAFWAYSYFQSGKILDSLLGALTIAMSLLPEEIPVAFTTFMAIGAWKMMKDGVIVKRSDLVETLGSTTVICTDKTGTITQNVMQLGALYDFKTRKKYTKEEFQDSSLHDLIQYAMWSSEPVPFDPMEKTVHQVYEATQPEDVRSQFELVHEYPLEGKPPMMTHVLENKVGQRIIAAKGAPEAILAVSRLTEEETNFCKELITAFGKEGYRVLGVAKAQFDGNTFPEKQTDFSFEFIGFTVFYDPPKVGIDTVFQQIEEAGIDLKVITGDNIDTTRAIAKQAGVTNYDHSISGAEVNAMSKDELSKTVDEVSLFARMFPESKLTVVNALKDNGEIVAMLGDGVNDAPALKAAHIGVAMGQKGTEIAKSAADLIIVDDDLSKLVLGIAAGRRIYANLKKAIQYIISIHIPLITTVSIPLILGWIYPSIFTPIHVIFFELVMGPTCSIVYENEPIEKNTMQQAPRKMSETFLSWKELNISILQGVMIGIGVLAIYQLSLNLGDSETFTRAMVFTTVVFSNVFLTYTNRSFYYSVFTTLRYKNKLIVMITTTIFLLLGIILYVPFVADFFEVEALNIVNLLIAMGVSVLSVFWMEIYKWFKRRQSQINN